MSTLLTLNCTRSGCSKRPLLVTMLLGLAAGCAHQADSHSPDAPPVSVDWKAVDQAIGKPGAMQPGDVYKFGMPRSDLLVKVGDVQLKPTLALGSWLAFKPMPHDTMVMGDLVLLEEEVNPVLTKLQEGGIEQTAMHNHVFSEQPRVVYMHVEGHGDAVKLAAVLRAGLGQSKTPITPPSGDPPTALDLDTAQLDQILGASGKNNGGVYQFSVPRTEKITMDGMEIPPSMGLGTALNFQPLGSGKAAITGDFVLAPGEVNPVIRTLREHNIMVTALHSHMLTEEPRLFFMHFWAVDDALTLARGLRDALEQTKSVAKAEAK